MRSRPISHRSLLAAAVVVIALGVGGGGGGGGHRFIVDDGAGISSQPTPTGALDAVMRSDVDRIESTVSSKSGSIARLILLLAAPLSGVALLQLLAASRRPSRAGGPPALTRLRRWVGLRAPPAPSQLVVLTF